MKVWDSWQNGRVGGPEPTSSHKNTKITTTCWTTIDKKGLETTKKHILHPKTKKKSQWDDRILYLPGGQPTNFKIIILQRFSHRSESSEPHIRLLSLLVWYQEEEPPEHLSLKASGAWWQELHKTWVNWRNILRGHTQGSYKLGPRGKSSDFIAAWVRPTCWSWRVSWGGGRLWLTSGTRTLVAEVLGSTHWFELSEAAILTPRLGPTQ